MSPRLLAVLGGPLCLILTWAAAGDRDAAGDGKAAEALPGSESRETSPSALAIEIRPRKVFCGSLIAAIVRGGSKGEKNATIRWTSTRGLLHYDDLSEVHWRAPADPGPCRLEVEVSAGGETASCELAVEVRWPDTTDMVWIPPGTFLCGDVEGTRNTREVKTVQNDNDEPFHRVFLDGYWIDRCPVTNKAYARFLRDAVAQGMARVDDVAVMGEFEGSEVPYYYLQSYELLIRDYYDNRNARTPAFLHIISWDGKRFRIRPGHEDHPVVDVTWFGAAAFANFYGKRLPSDAQWEKAARGNDGRRFTWGDNLPTAYHVNKELQLTPVGDYSPLGDSPHGVADMLSPAFEWANDWFNADYYRDYYAEAPHRNPRGTFWGSSHSTRGFPRALVMRVTSVERPQATARRYNWEFEFLLGDSFANNESAFRTAFCPKDIRRDEVKLAR